MKRILLLAALLTLAGGCAALHYDGFGVRLDLTPVNGSSQVLKTNGPA